MRAELSHSAMRGMAAVIAVPVMLLVGYPGNQAPPTRQDRDSESLRISVDVALVVLHATVTDRDGSFVHDLVEQDFQVYEDGAPQRIRLFKNEDIPIAVGLVIDHSTTMLPKLAEVSAAAQTFVRASNPEDEMFVVNFNEKVTLGLPGAIRFTNDTAELGNAITAARTGGMTALYDAITKAIEELGAARRERKALIVVSDGGDNASARSLSQAMKLAAQSCAVIYTVGLFDDGDPDQNPGVLKRFAQSTGGEAFFPGSTGEVVAICERIARDVRHQYTIGYIPDKPANDGAYRAIRVRAQAAGHGRLSVRTRDGYIPGKPQVQEKLVR
jgi:Ca-activated chloride channel family protein